MQSGPDLVPRLRNRFTKPAPIRMGRRGVVVQAATISQVPMERDREFAFFHKQPPAGVPELGLIPCPCPGKNFKIPGAVAGNGER